MRDVSPITAIAALLTWIRKIFLAAAVVVISTMTASANPERWKVEGWAKTDFTKSAIPFGEILSGGPPKDGIPAIDKPVFEALAKLTAKQTPKTTAPVISLEINGDARAYPLRVLTWHEIANDTVGGIPVTVTYCPLCNAAIVFDRRLNGRVLDFGTSGKLRHSDLVMYDRQTESWWQQFSGEAIIGTLTGKSLKIIPSRLESFGEFAARFPNGRLLVPTDTAQRPYGTNPYVGYDTAKAPFLYRGAMPKGISPMARVIVFSKSA
ncbi:MAG TPA: DUF3179 domain-containing protein, partial [Hyphomicrobiaceae bacterium]|nr:DUF3179 domain-containing protein [Hyphomicrobiaceae bacterium]